MSQIRRPLLSTVSVVSTMIRSVTSAKRSEENDLDSTPKSPDAAGEFHDAVSDHEEPDSLLRSLPEEGQSKPTDDEDVTEEGGTPNTSDDVPSPQSSVSLSPPRPTEEEPLLPPPTENEPLLSTPAPAPTAEAAFYESERTLNVSNASDRELPFGGDEMKPTPKARLRKAALKVSTQNRAQRFLSSLGSSVATPFVPQEKQIKRVTFDASNHLSVLFQMHGSVWPRVLPYCLINVLITYGVFYGEHMGIDTTVPSNGHSFMAIMVSFLIIARAQITYQRFMECRGYLANAYRTCREIVQHSAVLTMQDMSRGAKKWRRDVAYRTILLLRVTMAAIEYKSSQVNSWEVFDNNTGSIENLELFVSGSQNAVTDNYFANTPQRKRIMKWAHGKRTLTDENFRAPIVLAYNLRAEIVKPRGEELLKENMHVNEELKILGFVSDFITAFHGLKKMITTPFPFPLVQMARTFLFFWVFTLPFALADDISQPVPAMIIMFFVTYGFIGLEYVSIELEDPFGDDPNDFDDLGMAQLVFEDIFITVFKCDGAKSASTLRGMIAERVKGNALDNYRRDLNNDLLRASMAQPMKKGLD